MIHTSKKCGSDGTISPVAGLLLLTHPYPYSRMTQIKNFENVTVNNCKFVTTTLKPLDNENNDLTSWSEICL